MAAVGGISFDDDGTGVLVGLLAVALSLLTVVATLFVTALLYAPLTMRRPGARNGQTWGKQLFGIRVVRMSREPSTFASAAAREVGAKLLLFGAAARCSRGSPRSWTCSGRSGTMRTGRFTTCSWTRA